MKHTSLILLFIFSFTFSFASPKIKMASVYGVWNIPLSWDLNRLPANGDSIVIPSNATMVVTDDVKLNDVHILVYGNLILSNNNSQINLDIASEIIVFKGGMIDGDKASQKIRIGGSLVYSGNQDAIEGPARATVASIGFQSIVLPVKFLGYSIAIKSGEVLIQWSTSEEVNAFSYMVERSFDASNWSVIATIAAVGNTRAVNNYTYKDQQSRSTTVYYRIKQVDIDGGYMYTGIKSIKTAMDATISVAATQNRVILQFPHLVKNEVVVRIITMNGSVVMEQKLKDAIGQVILNTTVKGNHVVYVTNGAEVRIGRQVIL